MSKSKRQLLYVDMESYSIYKRREDQLKKIIKSLTEISDSAIGKGEIKNLKAFLSNPKDYLIEKYWFLYCSNRPQHLNKANVFVNDTGVQLSMLNELKKELDKYIAALQEYAPTINDDGVIYKVKESKFKKYLKKDKEDHYNILKDFIDTAKKLKKKESHNQFVHLVRYSQYLTITGTDIDINKRKFI